jgi:hypothetical protein
LSFRMGKLEEEFMNASDPATGADAPDLQDITHRVESLEKRSPTHVAGGGKVCEADVKKCITPYLSKIVKTMNALSEQVNALTARMGDYETGLEPMREQMAEQTRTIGANNDAVWERLAQFSATISGGDDTPEQLLDPSEAAGCGSDESEDPEESSGAVDPTEDNDRSVDLNDVLIADEPCAAAALYSAENEDDGTEFALDV